MNMKKYLLPGLLIGTLLAAILRDFAKTAAANPDGSQASSDGTPYHAVDVYIEQQRQRLKLPGVSIAIVEGDQIVHLQGFGEVHPGGEVPSPQTSFFIGSTTKSFTALAVMQLVEAEKIDLDTSVQHYLPWFRVADPVASAQITVRHLLNQTSGLPLGPAWQLLADFDDRPEAVERQVRALSTLKLSRQPGLAFEYSNLNYNLLGLVIEAVSGESYTDYVQQRIFDPLEMNHSYTSKAAAKVDGLAVGHQIWFGMPIAVPDLPVPIGSLPSGQLISSAEDMGHYLIAQLNNGRYGETQLLSSEGIVELHRPAVEAVSAGIPMGNYGMGWYIDGQGQAKIVHHTGMVPDFYTYMALLPEQKKGVVLLINANHFTGELTLTEIGDGITALLTGEQPARLQYGVIPWAVRSTLLIPLLQIVGVVATLRLLARWRRDPQQHPVQGRLWGLYILPSALLNLVPIASGLGLLTSELRGFLMLFMPDLSWLAVLSGSFALVWTCLRTGLIFRVVRKPRDMQ